MYTVGQISALLAERTEQVALMLLPNGKYVSGEWCVGSIEGEEGKSLKVCLRGIKAGIFCDFATGDSGDLIDLWQKARNVDLVNAVKEAKQWLGIRDGVQLQSAAMQQKTYAKPRPEKCKKIQPESAVMTYLKAERKLEEEAIKAYRLGERERDIVLPFFRDDELLLVKYLSIDRQEGKKKISVEKDCQPCLFGWQAISGGRREITLCEGEIDAITLYQYGYPALSLPFGGGKGAKHQWLEFEFDRLAIFDVIYLCFDQDEVGQSTAQQLIERLGRHRCRIVKLPHKDANECLQQGITLEQMRGYFSQAHSIDPHELKPASAFLDEVLTIFNPTGEKEGLEPHWEKCRHKIVFRPHDLSIWTGINGHGKSQFLGHLMLMFMQQNSRICIASFEMKPGRLLVRMARQAGGLSNLSDDYVKAIHAWYDDKLWLFNLVGTAKTKRILEVFLYAHQRYGVDTFVIDSLMKCGIGEDDFNAQKAFIEQLCDFKNTYKCHIHVVVHPRKAENESEVPNKLDVKGTGAITDLADNVFTIWRNKKKEEKIKEFEKDGMQPENDWLDKPDCLWICDKQRNGEWEGKLAFWFDRDSFQYLSNRFNRPVPFVNYSKGLAS